MIKKVITMIVAINSIGCFSQTLEDIEKIKLQTNINILDSLRIEYFNINSEKQNNAIRIAKLEGIPISQYTRDGSYMELQEIDNNSNPIYFITNNAGVSRSTRANHLNSGGSLGLNLNGQNMYAYVWDGGHPRITHQEYDGVGGNNRVSIEDAISESGTQLTYHAAHVTGTIAASGVNINAKGMAPYSKVKSYKWNNDESEAISAASNAMLISNHSYGNAPTTVPVHYFGGYTLRSKNWDNIMFNAPYYLMVVSAGNDGITSYNTSPLNPSLPQYDKLIGHSTSKNNLVVANANDANVDNNGNLITALSISNTSSQGPTDDLRIKPDITGNGTTVFSTYESSDVAYNTLSGTSMAAPGVSGSLLLLQQHSVNNGSYMRAATLKGLALHTADDAGSLGPDAIFGWGLLNCKKAAEVITTKNNKSLIKELTLLSGQSYSIIVKSDGVSKLLASISWTDPAGVDNTLLNSGSAILINDLDIRVTKAMTTYYPWKLTGVNSNTNGDNIKDPFERIDVSSATGDYVVTITHKGSLIGGFQKYSLIISGIIDAGIQDSKCNCLNSLTFSRQFNLDDSCPITITNTSTNPICSNLYIRNTWNSTFVNTMYLQNNQSLFGANYCTNWDVLVDLLDANNNVLCSKIFNSTVGSSSKFNNSTKTNNLNVVKVYPNSSSTGLYNININELKERANIIITDLNGRTVYSEIDVSFKKEKTIDLSKFNSGIYILRITNGEFTYAEKLIKN